MSDDEWYMVIGGKRHAKPKVLVARLHRAAELSDELLKMDWTGNELVEHLRACKLCRFLACYSVRALPDDEEREFFKDLQADMDYEESLKDDNPKPVPTTDEPEAKPNLIEQSDKQPEVDTAERIRDLISEGLLNAEIVRILKDEGRTLGATRQNVSQHRKAMERRQND